MHKHFFILTQVSLVDLCKKASVLAVSLLIFNLKASAQLEKGTWMIGGNISFVTSDFEQAGNTRTNNTTFTFSPAAGYFLMDRFAIGVKLSVANHSTTIPGGILYPATKYNELKLLAGPFARYYLLKPHEKGLFNLFLEGNYSPGVYKISYKDSRGSVSTAINQFALSAGSVIFFNSSVGLELMVGYYKANDNTQTYQSPKGFQTSLGFQVHLGRDKL